jgi:hypothetical protein
MTTRHCCGIGGVSGDSFFIEIVWWEIYPSLKYTYCFVPYMTRYITTQPFENDSELEMDSLLYPGTRLNSSD